MTAHLEERINKHGYVDYHMDDDNIDPNGVSGPVCPQCQCFVRPNTGNGALCSSCAHDFEMHCAHDYAEGELG